MHALLTKLSDRLEIVSIPQRSSAATFGEDVAAGLRAAPKRLPSKYLYDDLGSALFEAITLLPEYYLTRAETEILRDWGWDIVRALGEPVEFLELGSGSAIKTRILIDDALRAQGTLRYSPIDISAEALRAATLALIAAYPTLHVRAYAADYFSILGSQELQFKQRVLAMFMGSNIGNYRPEEATELLTRIARSLRPGDGLLVGVDLKKARATLELAYDDPTGVTAAFAKNLLGRINRELGGEFDPRDFDHIAEYVESESCLNSYLQARRSLEVYIRSLDLRVPFAAGERIHTEWSYKYAVDDVARLGASAGFELARTWLDRAGRFSVNLLRRP
jgi:L-histidine N-alpha-methyltransferase